MDFNFISDVPLRNKIIESLEMVSIFHLNLEKGNFSRPIAKELRRMMILYYASIIEALLLYLYKKGKHKILKTEYADVQQLNLKYQLDSKAIIVVARKINVERHDRELMLDNLLKYFHEKKMIPDGLKDRIDKTRNIRNTFHLSKSRKGILCGAITVEKSSKTVVDVVSLVENALN